VTGLYVVVEYCPIVLSRGSCIHSQKTAPINWCRYFADWISDILVEAHHEARIWVKIWKAWVSRTSSGCLQALDGPRLGQKYLDSSALPNYRLWPCFARGTNGLGKFGLCAQFLGNESIRFSFSDSTRAINGVSFSVQQVIGYFGNPFPGQRRG